MSMVLLGLLKMWMVWECGFSSPGGWRCVLVGDRLEPVHDVVVFVALVAGEVDHEAVRGRAVPVLIVGPEQQAVTRLDDLARSAAPLAQSDALDDQDGLAQ